MGSVVSILFGADASAAPAGNPRGKTFHSSASWKIHFNALKETPRVVVIAFSASWCGTCKFVVPAIHAIVANNFTDFEFIKIDVDELPDVAQEFQVQAVPTFVLMKEGKEIDRVFACKED